MANEITHHFFINHFCLSVTEKFRQVNHESPNILLTTYYLVSGKHIKNQKIVLDYLDNCFSNMLVKVKLLVTSINLRLRVTIFANDSSRQICLNKDCPVAPELPKMRQFILVDFDSVWRNKIDLYLKLNWTVAASKFSFLRHFTLRTFLKKIKFSESQGIDFQKMSYWICILICT